MRHEGVEAIRYPIEVVLKAITEPEITSKKEEARRFGLAVNVIRRYAPSSVRVAVFEGLEPSAEPEWKEILETDKLIADAMKILESK